MLRLLTLTLIGMAFVAYLIAFGQMSMDAVILFFPFTMIPYVLIAFLVMRWQSVGSQVVFFITTLTYSIWFACVYLDATVWNRDPQSAIAFLFVSIYAAPVLFVPWLLAYSFEWNVRSRSTT